MRLSIWIDFALHSTLFFFLIHVNHVLTETLESVSSYFLPFDFQNNDYIEYIIYVSICYRNIWPSVNNLVAHYKAKHKLQFGSSGHSPALLGLCMSLLASMCHAKMWYQTHDWWSICYCKWFDRTWLKHRAVHPSRSSGNKDDPWLG